MDYAIVHCIININHMNDYEFNIELALDNAVKFINIAQSPALNYKRAPKKYACDMKRVIWTVKKMVVK